MMQHYYYFYGTEIPEAIITMNCRGNDSKCLSQSLAPGLLIAFLRQLRAANSSFKLLMASENLLKLFFKCPAIKRRTHERVRGREYLNISSNNFSHDNPFVLCLTCTDLFIFPFQHFPSTPTSEMCLNLLSQFKHFYFSQWYSELFFVCSGEKSEKHFRSFVSTGKFSVSIQELSSSMFCM